MSNLPSLSVFKPLQGKSFEEVCNMCRNEYHMKVKYTQDLYLLKYLRDQGADINNNFVCHSRGIIFDRSFNKPVCYSMCGGVSYQTFKDTIPVERVRFEESIDGTMINVFYYKDQWRVSTKGCIDAKRSRWGSSKSFYTMFNEACNFDIQELNKNYCYTFVLVHKENRIVAKYNNAGLYLVFVRDMTTLEPRPRDEQYMTTFTRPKTLTFASYEELEEHLTQMPYNCEGVMLFDNENMDTRVKCKGDAYLKVKNMKGNHQNKRYGLLNKILQGTDIEYLRCFPEDYNMINDLKRDLDIFVRSIFYHYKNSKVYKNEGHIPAYIAPIVYNLHGLYIQKVNRNKNYKTSKNVIHNHVFDLDTSLVYYLLTQHKKYVKSLTEQTKTNITSVTSVTNVTNVSEHEPTTPYMTDNVTSPTGMVAEL